MTEPENSSGRTPLMSRVARVKVTLAQERFQAGVALHR